jgi:general secretion pathway protein D
MKIIKILFNVAMCCFVAGDGFAQMGPIALPPSPAMSMPLPANQPAPVLSLPMPQPTPVQSSIPAAAIAQMAQQPGVPVPLPMQPAQAPTPPQVQAPMPFQAPVTLTLPGMPNPVTTGTVSVSPKPPVITEPPKIQGEVQVPGKSSAPSSGDKKIDAHDEEENIYLNFENASLASLLHYLGEQKKINVLPHKDLENAKVTLTTRKPLTFQRAWDILLTLLEMNGFTMVKVGKLYRIVSSNDNGQEPLPVYSSNNGIDPEKLPDSDIVIRYVYFFKNMKTPTAKSILATMIEDKNIIENPDLNACVIKGKSLTIKTAMKIITELDSGGLREAIEIVRLRWTSVDNVKKIFVDIFGGEEDNRTIRFSPIKKAKESAFFSSDTKIIPEPVTNSLILMGTQKNIDKIKSFLAKYIDIPIENAASRIHMKELKYLRATDACQLLINILKTPRGSAGEKAMVVEGGFKIFEDVVISAEGGDDSGSADGSRYGSGNRLVIACNRDDWTRIEEFIDKLDKPQPQVAIEVMVVDISLDQEKQLGTQLYNVRGNPVAHNVNAAFDNLAPGAKVTGGGVRLEDPLINLAKSTAEGKLGPAFFTLGRAANINDPANENIWALVKAMISITNNQVISQPYLVANNNQPCQETVKTTWRVPGDLSSGSSINVTRPLINLDASVIVSLTPHINLTGSVDLEIDVTVNSFNETNITEQPTTTIRQLKTKASMATGEV